MASFRPDFHTNLAYNFVNDIYYGRRRLHAYLGRVWPWQSFVDTNYEIDKCECDCEYCENKNGTNENKQTPFRAEPSSVGDGFMSIPDGIEDEGLPF